jgi:hypothetical protein
MDPEKAAKRCGFAFDRQKGAFSVCVLGFELLAGWPEFSLAPASGACPAVLCGAAAKILVIRYLTEGTYGAAGGGFLTYRELPWGEVYDRNFQGRCIKRLAFSLGSRLPAFENAAQKLGGVRLEHGDSSYELSFFPWLKIRLILWTGDEEFPPASQFLFSDNVSLAFTAEDLAVAGDVIIGALKELSAGGLGGGRTGDQAEKPAACHSPDES